MYEFNLIINICKNSYRYFKIIDKIFAKILRIYDESYDKEIVNDSDYIKMFKEIYDMMIKTKVNDVHRAIATEDEYLEYSKILASEDEEQIDTFLYQKAKELTDMDSVRERLEKLLNKDEEKEDDDLEELAGEEIDEENLNLDEVVEDKYIEKDEVEEENIEVAVDEEKTKRRAGRPKKENVVKEKRKVGRPKKK